MYKQIKLLFKLIIGISFATMMVVSYIWYQFIHTPLNISQQGLILVVEPGTTIGRIAYTLQQQHVIKGTRLFRWLALFRQDAKRIKVGEYFINTGTTPGELLQQLVDGRVVQYAFTVVAGWRVEQLIAALHMEPKINKTLHNITDAAEIIAKLNRQKTYPEGAFWADTYFFPAGTTDIAFLQRAYDTMQEKLRQEWQERDFNCMLKNPKEALILASIIEKETSLSDEYSEVSGVYHRRLQQRMRLQADPAVLYAISRKTTNFNGSLRKKDLKINSPYNTYKNYGLPPTPIAIPSPQALTAAVHPADGETLYFVADGNGGHIFSTTLKEHNKAVALYKNKLKNNSILPVN